MYTLTFLKNYLQLQSNITALVPADRMYFAFVAAQSTAKPYIVITGIDNPGEHSHEHASNPKHPRIQISIFATNWTNAHDIAAALKAALDGYTGYMSTVYVQAILFEDESDGYDTAVSLYYVDQDYFIWYQE